MTASTGGPRSSARPAASAFGAWNAGQGGYNRGVRPTGYVNAVMANARRTEEELGAPMPGGGAQRVDVNVGIRPLTIIHRNERGETLGVETVQPVVEGTAGLPTTSEVTAP